MHDSRRQAARRPESRHPGPRTIVSKEFRAPIAEQFSLQFQRELAGGFVFSMGYVGTKGTALFQTIDGNPTCPTAAGVVAVPRATSGQAA